MSRNRITACLVLAVVSTCALAQETKPAQGPAEEIVQQRALAALSASEPLIKLDQTRPGRPVVAVRFRPNYGEVRDELLVHLRAFPELTCVELPNKRFVSDAGLAHLANLAHLEEVDLNSTAVTPAGLLKFLKGRTNMRSLNLTGIPLTDDDLAALAELSNLEELSLRATSITDAGVAHVAALKKLRALSLMSTKIGDAGLAHLKHLTQLEDLDLDYTLVTDAGLPHLSRLLKLRRLQFAQTPVTDAGLAQLEPIPRLKNLNVRNSKVTPAALEKYLAGRSQGDEDPAPILGEWNSIDRHVALGSLFQPVHGVRKREAKVYFQVEEGRLTGHCLMDDHKAISFQERWTDGRTNFREVKFADGRLTFEFDIDEWRITAAPLAVEDARVKNKGTVRVEARLRGERLVGVWHMFTVDGAEVFRGEWEATRPTPSKTP